MYKTLARPVTLAIATLALTALAGCGPQIGAILYHTGLIPEDKTKTQFKLTQNKLAILIDDPTGAMPTPDLRNYIHATIAAELIEHKACTSIVPASDIAKIERANRDFDGMSIRAIGEQVHADQVLYIQIQSFAIGEDSAMGVFQGKARALIKVCSTLKKPDVRLWPLAGDGQSVDITQAAEQTEDWKANERAPEAYGKIMSVRLGKRIAMLFYEHATEDEQDIIAGRRERPK